MERTVIRTLCFALALALSLFATPSRAADDTILKHVGGTTGFTTAPGGTLTVVTGSQILPPSDFAVTQNSSQAVIQLADSSTIGLGANTTVSIGALQRAADGSAGSTITVPGGQGAWFRFDIKHPSGAKSNYRFVTPTSSVSARGTVGLISVAQNGDTISCITCEPNDVAVTVGTRTFPLLSGQTLVVTLAGVVTSIATTAAILSSFSGAGLSTSATAVAPVAGAAGTAGAVSGTAAAVAGAAVAAGAAAAASSNNGGNTTQSAPTAQPLPAPTTSGTGTIQSRKR